MEDQDAEEDPYSDDDLDALPDNAFHELEENAFKSTQQAANVAPHLPAFKSPPRPNEVSLAGGFGRLSVAPEVTIRRPQHGLPPSSDYGDFDDEMLDGEIFNAAEQPGPVAAIQHEERPWHIGESTQRELWRQQRYAQARPNTGNHDLHQPVNARPARKEPTKPQVADRQTTSGARYQGTTADGLAPNVPVQAGADVVALQSQIQKVGVF